MRCQACDKNEATTTVICEGCKTHYASIREGQYRELELAHGELTLVIHSWTSLPATAEKKKRRAERGPSGPVRKTGLFGMGKAAANAPEPEPPPPPPDWKNRVFPDPMAAEGPDHEQPTEAAEAPEIAAGAEPELSPYMLGIETDFSYGIAENDAAPMPVVIDEPEADNQAPGAVEVEPEPVAEIFDLTPAADAPDLAASLVEEAVASVTAPADPVAEEAVTEPEPAPSAELSSFFESLASPVETPVAESAVTTPLPPEPSVGSDLESFFESLGAPVAPVMPEPVATAEVEAPMDTSLNRFFEDLAAPPESPAEALAEPPVEAPGIVDSGVDLTSFFSSLTTPTIGPPASTTTATPAAPVGPTLDSTDELADFFETLVASAEPAENTDGRAEPGEARKPFAIDIGLGDVAPAPTPGKSTNAGGDPLRPPTYGQPFAIDLPGKAETTREPAVRPKTQADELKKAHSTGELAFVGDDEDDDDAAGGGGLFDGLSFGADTAGSGATSYRSAPIDGDRDDEDGGKTIDL